MLDAGDMLPLKGDVGFPLGTTDVLFGDGEGRAGGALVGGPLAAIVAVLVCEQITLKPRKAIHIPKQKRRALRA